MDWKSILIWLLIFIVGSLIVSFLIYPQSFQSFKSNIKSIVPSPKPVDSLPSASSLTSIKDLSQNPADYVGKEVRISGTLQRGGGFRSLQDSEGYWICIGGNVLGGACLESQREYNYDSKIYTAEGTLVAPATCAKPEWGGCYGYDFYYKLECTSPLY